MIFQMFSILLRTARDILYIFNSVFQEKVHDTVLCSSSIACQEIRTDRILEIFTFSGKNPLYLSHNLNASVFLKVKLIKE